MKLHLEIMAGIVVAFALTACSGPPTPTPASGQQGGSSPATVGSAPALSIGPTTDQPTEQPSGAPTTLGSTLGPATSSDPSTPPPSGSPMPSGAPTPSLLTTTANTALSLGTANAFHADGWAVVDAQAAGAAGKTAAMSSVINCDGPGSTLEYRFSNSTGTVEVEAAQDVLSVSSTNSLSVSLMTDGKAVAEQKIGFKQRATLRAPLAGVTVLQVVVKPTGACTTSTTALITKATATG